MLMQQEGKDACAEPQPRHPRTPGVGTSRLASRLACVGSLDPRTSASLPGPPPRQLRTNSSCCDAPSPITLRLVEPVSAPRSWSRSAGFTTSAAVHVCVVIGLSLLIGPLHLGRDKPLELNLFTTQTQPQVDPIELEAAFDVDLMAPRFELLTALPNEGDTSFSTLSVISPFDGRGGSGPRGTFFGTVAHGTRFIYVLDVSGSMKAKRGRRRENTRLRSAIDELLYSVDKLTTDQYFYVVLFSDDMRQMFDEDTLLPELVRATPENKRRLRQWLEGVRPGSGTDPRAALDLALQMTPSAVFLLSDGEFNGQKRNNNRDLLHGNPSIDEVVAAHDTHPIPVHTIALEDRANRRQMQALSAQTGGEYRYVPPIELPSVE